MAIVLASRRLALVLSLCLAGCASDQDKSAAIRAVNAAFQTDYEAMLADRGLRTYRVRTADAFAALRATFSALGMHIADQDLDLGTMTADATAPLPLNAQEWRQAADVDLPRMREIARPYVGVLVEMIRFEPEGLEIVIHATVLATRGGSEVSLTTRMREIAPPRTNMPRREYPPPTSVQIALDKIWRQFETELRVAGKLP